MRKKGMKTIAYFTVILVLAGIFAAGMVTASPDNAREKHAGTTTDDIIAENRNMNDTYDHRMNTSGVEITKRTGKPDHATNFVAAKSDFAIMRSQNPNMDTQEAIDVTKTYLISSIDYMLTRIDNMVHINKLNDERNKVENATSRKELSDSAGNIRTIWNEAHRDIMVSSGRNVDNRVGEVIRTSESIIVRLENEIASMKTNGQDVEELEVMLARYKELVISAREKHVRAVNIYDMESRADRNNIREANRYLVAAGKELNDSNAVLRKMLTELRQQRQGMITLNGEDVLTARGNGTAVISGDVNITFTASEAKLVIRDLTGTADINLSSAEYERSNEDAGNGEDDNRAFVYTDITGDVQIEGERLTVMVQGLDMELVVSGTGTTVLSGNGTYNLHGQSGEWAGCYMQ